MRNLSFPLLIFSIATLLSSASLQGKGYVFAQTTASSESPQSTTNLPCNQSTKTISLSNKEPNDDINDSRVNPDLRLHLQNALKAISDAGGLHVKINGKDFVAYPKIHEIYRSSERSDELVEPGKAAAPGGGSAHNYGLAVDIYLFDKPSKGAFITSAERDKETKQVTKPAYPNYYKYYEQLAPYLEKEGFIWYGHAKKTGDKTQDPFHFEYHPSPSWNGLSSAAFLKNQRQQAQDEAKAAGKSPDKTLDWLPYMWKNAGACSCNTGKVENSGGFAGLGAALSGVLESAACTVSNL